jgi:hypothetical protein
VSDREGARMRERERVGEKLRDEGVRVRERESVSER